MSAAPAVQKPKAKRSWWRRWLRRLVIAAVAARLLLAIGLGTLVNFGAGFAGLSVSWRSHSLSLLGLSLHIEDLEVRIKDQPALSPLLRAQDLIADLSMRQLLSGDLSVVDAGLSGARITVHRQADGTLSLPASWLEPGVAASTPATNESQPAVPLDFRLPCQIASARLQDVRFTLIDETVSPAVQHQGTLDLDIAEVGFPDHRGTITTRLHAPSWFDALRLHADVTTRHDRAELSFQLSLHGVRPHSLELPEALLQAVERAHVVDLDIDGGIAAAVLPEAPQHPALEGHGKLRLQLDGRERGAIDIGIGPSNPSIANRGGLATPFSIDLQLQDVVERLQVQDGRLALGDDGVQLAGSLLVQKLTLRRLRALLASSGIEVAKEGVDVQANLDLRVNDALSIDLRDFTIGPDRERQLALQQLSVVGLRSAGEALAIDEVTVVGPMLEIHREADGALVLAGLRLSPDAGPEPSAAPTQPVAPSAAAPGALPKLRVGKLDWSGTELRFLDATTTPPATLALQAVEVHGVQLVCGEAAPPGSLTISALVPEAIERITFEAKVTPSDTGLSTDASLRCTGLGGEALAPWLARFGLACDLQQGLFSLALTASVQQLPDGLSAAAQIVDLRLVDLGPGDREATWLKVHLIEGTGLRASAAGLDIGTWTVREPFVAVRRDADGTLHLLGTSLTPLASATAAPATAPAAAPARVPLPQPDGLPDTSRPLLRHGALRLEAAVLAFTDLARGPEPRTFRLDASLGANAGTSAPLPVQVTLGIPGAIDQLGINAMLRMVPDDLAVEATITGRGLRGAGLAELLPPGITCTLVDGHLDLTCQVQAQAGALLATVRGLVLGDGADELFAVDQLLVDVPRLGADEVHVRELSLRGVRSALAITTQALQVPGFAIGSAPATPPESAPIAASSTNQTPPAALLLPKLRIDAMQIEVERITVRDRRGEDAPPLTLRAVAKLDRPWLGDPAAELAEAMPCTLRIEADPLGAVLEIHADATPFAASPTLDATVSLTDFDTTRLVEVMPALAEQLRGDARALEAKAVLHAAVLLRRRDVQQFELGRPFGFELHLSDVVLRDAATDRTFAAVHAIDVLARSFDPRTGDLLLRSVEIDEPKLVADQAVDGLHVAGVVLLPAAPPAPAAARDSAPIAARSRAPIDDAAKPAEVAIDRLRVFGLDAAFRDATTQPATELRLTDTDAELLRFSTAGQHEARPFSFSVTAHGGEVELPRRVVHSSIVHGLLSAAGDMTLGRDDQQSLERRPMLDQATARGQLQLWPRPKGRVQVAIDTLELPAFRGLAKQGGVDLSDGTYDLRSTIDLLGYDGINITSRHVLTWLGLSEPADGPISTYLRLPAPLQTVLFLLRNAAAEQRLAIDLHVPAEGVNQAAIVELAVDSLTRIITDSVTGAGSRLTRTLTDPFFGSGETVTLTAEASFRPGSPLPTPFSIAAITTALADDATLSLVLTHELGAADLHHAEELANPPAAVVDRTVGLLRQQREELERQREPLAREVAALYLAARHPDARLRHAELRRLDTRLGELQETLRRGLDMVSTQSPRATRRRTRSAIEALATSRCDAIEAQVRAACPNLDPARIERRLGRPTPTEQLPDGGRIVLATRRRLADAPDPNLLPDQPTTPRGFDAPRTDPTLVDPTSTRSALRLP